MKIKVKELSYEDVIKLPKGRHHNPVKPSIFFRWLVHFLSAGELKRVGFSYRSYGMEKLGKNEPCLILMNHSCFIDLKIAETLMYPRPLNIVCTSDGLVGKEWLMRHIGCIPTNKFVTDVQLVKDMRYALTKLKSSVLMYPEASYSFDGTATPLPDSIGKCLKILNVPVVMIRTYGAFLRDPLYNNLQNREVKVSADIKYLLSPSDIEERSAEELNDIIKGEFEFDNFKWQQQNEIQVTEDFRADYLNRVLYKCPDCMAEGKMEGRGVYLTCKGCGKKYRMNEYGQLQAEDRRSLFTHIPDWYRWQREEIKKELLAGIYRMELDVDIYMLVDLKQIYKVGSGVLLHDNKGFLLRGCDGKLEYRQSPNSSYSLYADYYWYELGDMICIGDMKCQYYCFPKGEAGDVVAKARIATEELYKQLKKRHACRNIGSAAV